MENIIQNYGEAEDDDIDKIELNDESSMIQSIESVTTSQLKISDPSESIINITESVIETLKKSNDENQELRDIEDDYVKIPNNDSDSSSDTSSDESLIYQFRNKKLTSNQNNESDDEEDDEDDEGEENVNNKQKKANLSYPKTKGEITLDELPVNEFQHFTLNENETTSQIGLITSIVGNLVVVQSNRNSSPLDEDTILFDHNRHTIGKIYETFGPVCQPFYTIRVNSNSNCSCKYELNSNVYYVPNSQELTKYIFNIEQLKKIKGSDASWFNDNEPPIECLDYSDDEEERLNKQKLKANKNPKNTETNDEVLNKKPKITSNRPQQQQQQQPQLAQRQQQQQFRQRGNNFVRFRQPFFIQQPPQLINQSFQQMMSPNLFNMQNQYQHHFQPLMHPPLPFNRMPIIRPNNLVDQRFIQNNDIKKSF